MRAGWRWVGGVAALAVAAGVALAAPQAAQGQQIAITFDDLPAHGPLPPHETRVQVAEQVLHALRAAGVPPTYGFVNGVAVEKDPGLVSVLGAWRASGNVLGNHTWSHGNPDTETLGQFEQDAAKDEPLLELQMNGEDWHWLRFPYLAEGSTAEKRMGIRAYLAQHGYRIAGVTMSFDDWEWNEPYARCVAKREWRQVGWLEGSYLRAAAEELGRDREMSEALYGRQIAYVLLLHIGAFDARMLPKLLAMYRRQGATFVPLAQAETDPFYRYDANPKLLPGPDTLEGVLARRHLPAPARVDYGKKLNAICR